MSLLEKPYNNEMLMRQLQEGSKEAFTVLYELLYLKVFWFARKFVEARADAEDFTADAFVQLWQRRAELPTMEAVSGFLHVTVRNKCYDHLRHQQVKSHRHAELLQLLEQQDTSNFHTEQVRIEIFRRIYAEVDKLPPRMREVFLLSYDEGLKPAQIAERLQVKVQTVTNQRVTAIRVLQAALSRDPLSLALLALLELQLQAIAQGQC